MSKSKHPFDVQIDDELSVGYIRFNQNPVVRQWILDEEDTLIVDYDEQGDVVGIEIASLVRLERLARDARLFERTKEHAIRSGMHRVFTKTNLPTFVLPIVAKNARKVPSAL